MSGDDRDCMWTINHKAPVEIFATSNLRRAHYVGRFEDPLLADYVVRVHNADLATRKQQLVEQAKQRLAELEETT